MPREYLMSVEIDIDNKVRTFNVYKTELICSEFLLDIYEKHKLFAQGITPYELITKIFLKNRKI